MRLAVVWMLLSGCVGNLGCALGWVGTAGLSQAAFLALASDTSNGVPALASDLSGGGQPVRKPIVLAQDQATISDEVVSDEAPPDPTTVEIASDDPPQVEDRGAEPPASPFDDDAQQSPAPSRGQEGPELIVPRPAEAGELTPDSGEADIDRFQRRLSEVPLDIRPVAGELPPDLSLEAISDTPLPSEPGPAVGLNLVPVAYSPWTICYRPLYFEDIPLERYGETWGILQPAVSGAKFFGSVAALPYKMTVRPPRSCECSNGFSRCGDLPLPGYGRRVLSADAALVESVVVAGIVLALP